MSAPTPNRVAHAITWVCPNLTKIRPTPHVCTYLPCLHLCLTMWRTQARVFGLTKNKTNPTCLPLLTVSAPTPNCVAHASTCVWPNLTKNKTNPTCLHLLTVSAPTPNRVAHASTCVWPNLTKNKTNPTCLHLLPCLHLSLTMRRTQACVFGLT